jgi:hypothetical protein
VNEIRISNWRVAFGQGVDHRDHRRLPAHPTLCESGIGEGLEGISSLKKKKNNAIHKYLMCDVIGSRLAVGRGRKM